MAGSLVHCMSLNVGTITHSVPMTLVCVSLKIESDEKRERKTIDDYYDQPQAESHGREEKKERKLLTSLAELELFSFFW